ncbi:uncharacterized protein LOC135085264 [Ostrinia nubilalis]|uniref:uncharacterized protein LOC135085264 n=1 Tax=Ostrinia nubilalis TaxID=29057 RepID=UPI0030822664
MDIVSSDMSYLINLDHLDLNYVSNYDFKNGGSPFSLWDVNSSKVFGNEKEYFEFKVMAKKVADDGADSSSEPGDDEDEATVDPLYKCAICDRDVPLTYKKQHIDSVKHQTCVQIAKAVLQRIQNNLTLENENEIIKNSTLTYFCEPCTAIVRNTDKQQHEGSEAHQKSVLRDLYLSDLLNIYNDENYLDTADMQYMSQKPNEHPKNFENGESSLAVGNETVAQEKGIQEGKETLVTDNKQIKKKNNPVHEQNGKFSDKCQDNTLKVTENKIPINKPSNSKQNITNNDQTDSTEECDLNDNKVDKQKQTTSITEQSKVTDENNYLEKSVYKQSPTTSPARKKAKIESQNNVTSKRNDSEVDYIMLVDTNEFKVDTEADSVLGETKLRSYVDFLDRKNVGCETDNHKVTVISRNYVQITTLDNNVVTVPADNFNGFQKPYELLLCNICMVRVDDPGMHILEKMHLEMIRLPLKDIHCFRELNAMCRHCVHCNAVFVSTDAHEETSKHKAALQKSLEGTIPTEPAQTKKVGRTYCEPCNLYIDSHNFNSHTKGKPHKNNLSLFFTKEKKESSTNNSQGKIHCEPCGTLIRTEMFLGHTYGKTHRAALKLTNESKDLENCCSICNILTEDLTVHLTSDYHEFHVNRKSGKKVCEPKPSNLPSEVVNKYLIEYRSECQVTCRVCGVKISNRVDNVNEHLNGRSHRTNYNNTLQKNSMKTVGEDLFCKLCKVTVKTTEELDHMTSTTHCANKLKSETQAAIAISIEDTEDAQSSSSSIPSQSTSGKISEPKHSKPPPEVIKKYQVTHHSETQVICRVCGVKIPNRVDNINEHINGRSHKINYTSTLQENSMKTIGENFFCELCKVTVKTSEELEHIISTTHCAHKIKSQTEASTVISTGDTPISQSTNSSIPIQSTNSSIPTQDTSSLIPEASTTTTSVYRCETCEEDVVNTPSAIEEHMEGLSHKITKIFWKLTNESLEDNLHYHYERVSSSMVYCRICKIDVLASNAEEHLESFGHNLKYRSHLAENDVRKLSDSKFYCNVCSIDVKVEEELQHIRLLSHSMKKSKTKKGPIEEKTIKDSAEETASTTSQASSSSKGTGYRCAVCNVDVPNNPKNIKMHDQGNIHRTKLKNLSLEEEEKVLFAKTPNDKEVTCTLCNVTVPVTGLSCHVRGAKHKANKNAAVGGK